MLNLFNPIKVIKLRRAKRMKLHLNSIYGLMITDCRKELKEMAKNNKTLYHDTDSVVHGWQKLPDHILSLTVREFQEVMDDALANGFEFRLQGSIILYREVQS